MVRNDGSVAFTAAGAPGNLLVHPRILPDEWWDSYVVRVLQANGVQVTDEYFQRSLEARVLRAAGGEALASHQVGHDGASGCMRFGVHTLPRWAVRGKFSAAQACLGCLDEVPYLRMRWRLRGAICCARHGLDLLTACPVCRRRVLLWEVARRQCKCGATLDSRSSSVARACDVELQCRLDGEVAPGLKFQPSSMDREAGERGDIADAGQTVALRAFLPELLTALASVRIGEGPRTCKTAGQFVERLGAAPRLETDWVSELWRSLDSAAHLSQALTCVLKLLHEEQSATTALSTLPLWAWAEQLSELGASSERAERRGWIERGRLRAGLLPLTQIARRTGLGKAHLRAMVRRGEVEPTKTLLTGHKRVLLVS
jgi:hypothetical protein